MSLVSIRESNYFMTRVGTEVKVLWALKNVLPHHLLKSSCLYHTEEKQ